MYFRGSQTLAGTAQRLGWGSACSGGRAFFSSRSEAHLTPRRPSASFLSCQVADQEGGGSGMAASGPLLHTGRGAMSQKGRCGK